MKSGLRNRVLDQFLITPFLISQINLIGSHLIHFRDCTKVTKIIRRSTHFIVKVQKAGGRNVDDQNVDRPKISERRNGLFS